jgi:hypothetical protein
VRLVAVAMMIGSTVIEDAPQVEISLRYHTEEELAAYRRLSQVSSMTGGSGKGKTPLRGLSPMRGRPVGARTPPTLKSLCSKEILQKWDGRVREASEDAREMDRLQRKLDRLTVSGSRQPGGSRDGQRASGSAKTTAAKEESEEDSEEDDSEDIDYGEE